jgi:hypothetical protein
LVDTIDVLQLNPLGLGYRNQDLKELFYQDSEGKLLWDCDGLAKLKVVKVFHELKFVYYKETIIIRLVKIL